MLHSLITNIINENPEASAELMEKYGNIFDKISAHFKNYDRDIQILEHASKIANEDYEKINKKLSELNKELDQQVTKRTSEIELLSQFPLVNPSPVFRLDIEGKIEFKNKAAAQIKQIEYKNNVYETQAFMQMIMPDLKASGHFQIKSNRKDFLFNYQFFQTNNKVNLYGVDITTQVQLQQRAYENFYRLNNFLESTDSVHYIIYKNKFENNFFTSRWPLLYGFNPAKVNNPFELKKDYVLLKSLTVYEQALATLDREGYVKFQYQIQNPITGKKIWLEEEIKKKYDPFLDDDVTTGKVIDISATQQLKETAAESEERFRQITDSMPVMIWVSNEKNKVTYSNNAVKKFFGKGLEEFNGPDEFASYVHPDSTFETGDKWLEDLLQHKQVENEFLLRDAEGVYHFIYEKAIPRFLPSGEFLGHIGAFFDLTKEYTFQQELQKEKKQLELIAGNSNDIVLLTDVNGVINYVSPSVKRILRFEVEELKNKSIYTYFCPMCQSMIAPQIQSNSFNFSSPETYKFRLVAASGEEIWTESLISAIQTPTRETNLLWHIRDINDQQKAFQHLQQSEETNRLIMNSAMDAIVCMDTNGNLNFWSKQAERIFGWTADEVMTKPMSEVIIPSPFKELHDRGMANYLETGEHSVLNKLVEVPALRKGGNQFPAELTIIHVKTETQNFFCAFIRDVSERKTALDALKASEERYRSLFENMALGVMEVDNDEQIIYANESMCGISGFSINELLGQNAKDLFIKQIKTSGKIHSEHTKKREAKTTSIYEMDVVKKDGSIANWVISGAPLFDVKGNLRGSVGIHWDITKMKQMEEDLLNEKINKEKTIFEATLQAEEDQRSQIGRDLHDGVGQMLAYMTLYMNMIKAKGKYGNDELEELQRTAKQTLEQVRTLSRNLAPPAIEDLGLRDAVIEMINSYSILKTPVFQLDIYDQKQDNKIVMSKKTVVYRVLQELINNTFKYAEANKVAIKISIKQKMLHVEYLDNGKGFDLKKIRKGVGIESMRSRVKYHKGDIDINTSPGHGFSVRLKIPL